MELEIEHSTQKNSSKSCEFDLKRNLRMLKLRLRSIRFVSFVQFHCLRHLSFFSPNFDKYEIKQFKFWKLKSKGNRRWMSVININSDCLQLQRKPVCADWRIHTYAINQRFPFMREETLFNAILIKMGERRRRRKYFIPRAAPRSDWNIKNGGESRNIIYYSSYSDRLKK